MSVHRAPVSCVTGPCSAAVIGLVLPWGWVRPSWAQAQGVHHMGLGDEGPLPHARGPLAPTWSRRVCWPGASVRWSWGAAPAGTQTCMSALAQFMPPVWARAAIAPSRLMGPGFGGKAGPLCTPERLRTLCGHPCSPARRRELTLGQCMDSRQSHAEALSDRRLFLSGTSRRCWALCSVVPQEGRFPPVIPCRSIFCQPLPPNEPPQGAAPRGMPDQPA